MTYAELANIFRIIEGLAIGVKSENNIKGLFDDVVTISNRLVVAVVEKTNN